MTDWLNQTISLAGIATTWLEILGFITGAICVYLNTQQNVWGWFFGIINAVLYAIVFWQVRLYADTGLQGYYFLTSIYGWWMWKFGGRNHDGISVTRTPARMYPVFGVIFLIITASWGFLLGKFTDASLTYADSALTVASLIGQWMMARKYLENWILWIIADACYVVMYFYKDLHLTAILYAVFLALAVGGYFQWRRDLLRDAATV
ncbi:nicotinamide riboside transporter PnuC [Dyadobacter chenwenxiniae]|uniref:Nicotinamide riboside transporter PnuC n=1 Tax=Dyadobacter chenwenxiniae TaxID=2906456 RepID=A0A9X1PTR5_9BACT|nr:nicotinamide riboside transporter PnuC [Dyadobacter chenwenxiniae]MCF0065478.1 nicotinamide riboside transporter PnuC [Dyadobacter chenwenxiniae]UON82114.1 nicotinamide riboside transporter PnuC [Dyadobacter chenwenxiniae]